MRSLARTVGAYVKGSLPVGLPETLAALPKINRRLALAVSAATVLVGLAPVGYIVATRNLVDYLTQSRRASPVVAIALISGFFALTEIMSPFFIAMAETFGYWINRDLRMRLMQASMRPTGLRHIEDPRAQDVLSRAVRIGSSGLTPGAAIAGLFIIGKSYVQGVGCAIILSTFRWWLGPIVLLMALLVSRLILRDFSNATKVLTGQSPVLRRANYFRGITTDPRLAGELRIFFLGDWVLDRFRERWMSAMQEVWTARRPRLGRVMLGASGITLCVFGAMVLLTNSVRDHSTSLGSFVMYAQALLGFLPMFAMSVRHLNITSGAAVMSAVSEFEAAAYQSASPPRGTSIPVPRADLIFDDVRFGYDSGTEPILRGVTFNVPYGSSLAIVGLNGAGKTTLIKLLARLYDPDGGRILWGGEDIRSLDAELWRQHLALLFQDFLRLPLTAADNVRCGAITAPLDMAIMNQAALEGNARVVLDDLPRAWDTRLARGYKDGVDLSGGQWQRIAAARAFYAVRNGAKLLVLDEPSSALDIRAEAQFFARFHDLEDVTRILISHRLATVRHADWIVLLDGGVICEQGSHDSLMNADGIYASLFRRQRERSVG